VLEAVQVKPHAEAALAEVEKSYVLLKLGNESLYPLRHGMIS
jgi:hypothetical protein